MGLNNYYLEIDNKWDAKVSAESEAAAVAKVLKSKITDVSFDGCEDDVCTYRCQGLLVTVQEVA